MLLMQTRWSSAAGRDLVHDLGDGRAVARAPGEAGRAERARLHARREVSGRLAVGVPGKAPVEDGDRDAGPVEPRRTRAVGPEERDALAGDGGRRERQRPLDPQDVRAGGERLEPPRRHEGLDERAVDVLDLAAVGLDRRFDGGGRVGSRGRRAPPRPGSRAPPPGRARARGRASALRLRPSRARDRARSPPRSGRAGSAARGHGRAPVSRRPRRKPAEHHAQHERRGEPRPPSRSPQPIPPSYADTTGA